MARGHNLRERDGDPTAHAEIVAMRRAARERGHWRLSDLTLVVTLEPCSSRGKTGPCTRAILDSGIRRVVVGALDPDAWEFDIDELRCIFCGMCEEACPVDAIELTPAYDVVGLTRNEMIFDKAKLLSVYDATVEQKPM